LAVPEMAAFLAKEGLVYADTVEAMLATLRSDTGYPRGTHPVVALVGNPHTFAGMKAALYGQAARWADHGLPTVVGHLGELARSNGRLRLRGEPIDVVYRLFAMEDVPIHVSDGHLEPLLSAGGGGGGRYSPRWTVNCRGAREPWPCCPSRPARSALHRRNGTLAPGCSRGPGEYMPGKPS